MVIDIEGFISVYSKISDNFRVNQDQFFAYWNTIPWNTPTLNNLSREPYVYTKDIDGHDAVGDDPLKEDTIKEINKYSKKYGLKVKASPADSIEEIEMKVLEFSRQLLESDKNIEGAEFNKIINKEYFEKWYSIPASADFVSSITRKELSECSVRICDAIHDIYKVISGLEHPIKQITENRHHIMSLFSGRKIRLVNGEFDTSLVKRATSKNLGFKYTKHTNTYFICRLIELIINEEEQTSSKAQESHQSSYLKGTEFEMEVYRIYKSLGYDVVITSATGDFGVDIIARSNSEKIGVQCKNLSSPVGVDAVMQIHSGGKFYDCTRYCIITTKGYTDAAEEMANKLGVEILVHRKM